MMTETKAKTAGRRREFFGWHLPRLLFVVSALVLVLVAAMGWPLAWLWVALGIFSVCSILFIARQIIMGHRVTKRLIWSSVSMCAVGIVLLLIYAKVRVDALPLCGSVLLVLGLGWLVEAWREAKPGSRAGLHLRLWGLLLLGVAAVSVVAWMALFPRDRAASNIALLIILGAGLLVSLPVALNLLSELGLRRLTSAERDPKGGWKPSKQIVLIGYLVLLVAAVSVVTLYARDFVLTAGLTALAAFLVPAIVSNTHADVAIVLAVLALLSAAPEESAAPGALTDAGGTKTLVALGDSYMSGEGASIYFAGTDDAGVDQCRRAPTAYAARVTAEEGRFDRLAFLACSGARTFNVIATDDDRQHAVAQTGEDGTQVDQIKRLTQANPSFRPSLVIVSLGGNDAGFATIGETCISPGDCSTQRALFEGNLPKVEGALVAAYASIRKALPGVPVLAVPYPQPIAERDHCDGVALTKAERDFIRSFLRQLNARIHAAADRSGVLYLAEMERSLESQRLQLCDGRKNAAGINFLDVHSVNGLASQRFNPANWLHNSLHPNKRGHGAMVTTLDSWLDENAGTVADGGTASPPGTSPAPATPAGTVAEPEPPCSLTGGNETSCQSIVRAWEVRQVKKVLLHPGMILLVGFAVLWAASILVASRVRLRRFP